MPVEVGPKTIASWKRALAKRRTEESKMPRGSKGAYTGKRKRQAEPIAKSHRRRGVSRRTAKSRARATVTKKSGGENKRGRGRGGKTSKSSTGKGVRR